MLLSEGQRKYCCVCKDWIVPGQRYEVLPYAKFCARHANCIPKSGPQGQRKDRQRPPTGSPKRRRAGGHGYYGGDGWVDI